MMQGISFITPAGNRYFYNNRNGLIFPQEYIEDYQASAPQQNEIRANPSLVSDYLAGQGWKELILEMTQACNFRCKYCCYSEHYPSMRSHGDTKMTAKTAISAIDYYLKNHQNARQRNPFLPPTIAFYGGEPLLNYTLIKELVEYVKTAHPLSNAEFTITTNGLLLTDEVIDFLVENHFSIIVSLDGDRENHDRNRRKADGSGSFDEVFAAIERFRKRYPDYAKFGISLCMDYRTNLLQLEKFIDEQQLFVISLAFIVDQETDYYRQFTEEEKLRFAADMAQLKERYFHLARQNKLSFSSRSLLLSLFAFGYLEFACHSVMTETRHPCLPYTGSCIPGEKLYATIDGKFHMCEKTSAHFPIGDIANGLDHKKIADLLNRFNSFSAHCQNCDISRLCNLCLGRATCGDEIHLSAQYCRKRRQDVTQLLTDYTQLMESAPENFDHYMMDYFSRLRHIKGAAPD